MNRLVVVAFATVCLIGIQGAPEPENSPNREVTALETLQSQAAQPLLSQQGQGYYGAQPSYSAYGGYQQQQQQQQYQPQQQQQWMPNGGAYQQQQPQQSWGLAQQAQSWSPYGQDQPQQNSWESQSYGQQQTWGGGNSYQQPQQSSKPAYNTDGQYSTGTVDSSPGGAELIGSSGVVPVNSNNNQDLNSKPDYNQGWNQGGNNMNQGGGLNWNNQNQGGQSWNQQPPQQNNYQSGFQMGQPQWQKSYTPMAGGCYNRCRPKCGYRPPPPPPIISRPPPFYPSRPVSPPQPTRPNYGCKPSCRPSCNVRPSCGQGGSQFSGSTMVCGKPNYNQGGWNQGGNQGWNQGGNQGGGLNWNNQNQGWNQGNQGWNNQANQGWNQPQYNPYAPRTQKQNVEETDQSDDGQDAANPNDDVE